MFKLQPAPTFKAKVGISIAGQARPNEIEVEYRYLTKEAIKTYFDNLQGKADADALAEIVVGWSGVEEAYSPEALSLLIDNYPAAASDLFDAFRRELLEAKRKN
ncbi:MAG: phage tail assembly chaperone [Sulfurisoma sp.]|nr:phage tail assembly chaperone [Sulfurisoma sp.]